MKRAVGLLATTLALAGGLVTQGNMANAASVESNCMKTVTPSVTNFDVGTGDADGSATISWTAPTCPDLTYFNIDYTTDGGKTFTVAADHATSPDTVSDLPCGTTFQFVVVAVHALGNSGKAHLDFSPYATDGNTTSFTTADCTVVITGTGDCDSTVPFYGHGIGFWSNKNGQALLSAHVSTWVAQINGETDLVNESGIHPDLSSPTKIKNWLVPAARAVNMAYMLSAQLAALELSVNAGFVSANAVDCSAVDTPKVGDLIESAHALLQLDGGKVTTAGSDLRDDEEIVKNDIDAINSGTAVTPAP